MAEKEDEDKNVRIVMAGDIADATGFVEYRAQHSRSLLLPAISLVGNEDTDRKETKGR